MPFPGPTEAAGTQTDLRAEVVALRAELAEVRHLAEEQTQVRRLTSAESAMTSSWLILCGALVMFMHAGFAMLETGSCRAKNASNVLMKNLVNVCVGTLGWY